jgi:hypothetical protein
MIVFAVFASGALLVADRFEAIRERRSPAATIVLAVIVVVWMGLPALIRRDVFESAIAIALIPTFIGNIGNSLADPNPRWAEYLRAAGFVLVIIVVLTSALLLSRRTRELDRFLFSEATSVAFFVTLAGAGAYAGVEVLLDLPRLSFAWLPLFGLTVWGIVTVLLWRRYA